MKSEHILFLSLATLAVSTIVVVHFGKNGYRVKFGAPFFSVELN